MQHLIKINARKLLRLGFQNQPSRNSALCGYLKNEIRYQNKTKLHHTNFLPIKRLRLKKEQQINFPSTLLQFTGVPLIAINMVSSCRQRFV